MRIPGLCKECGDKFSTRTTYLFRELKADQVVVKMSGVVVVRKTIQDQVLKGFVGYGKVFK